jgi:hypothetical protein
MGGWEWTLLGVLRASVHWNRQRREYRRRKEQQRLGFHVAS